MVAGDCQVPARTCKTTEPWVEISGGST
jgi:hypothetical protein